jgi:hypothetical protein
MKGRGGEVEGRWRGGVGGCVWEGGGGVEGMRAGRLATAKAKRFIGGERGKGQGYGDKGDERDSREYGECVCVSQEQYTVRTVRTLTSVAAVTLGYSVEMVMIRSSTLIRRPGRDLMACYSVMGSKGRIAGELAGS